MVPLKTNYSMISYYMGEEDPTMLRIIRRSWGRIYCKEKKDLGKRNCAKKEPYYIWVKERVQKIKLPFSYEVLISPHIPKPTHVPIQEAEEFKALVAKLEKENEELHLKLHQVTFERNKLRFDLIHKENQHGESRETATEERRKQKRVGDCLIGACLELGQRDQELRDSKRKNIEYMIFKIGLWMDKRK